MIDRRGAVALAAGGIALAARPAWAAAGRDDAALREVLDGLGKHPEPVKALKALAKFDDKRLSPVAAIDLVTIRFGLAIERNLAAVTRPSDRYALQLARACGANVRPGAAKARLQAERKRVETQAQAWLNRLAIAPGPTGKRFADLMARGDGAFAASDAGRAAAVAWMNTVIVSARAALPRWFVDLPPECTNVTVRVMTGAEAASDKGGFRILPDAGHAGAYVVDLRRISERPSWTLASVVHHELLPGHMVQLPLEERAAPHPLRLRYAAGFGEGWAIYAEDLARRGGLLPDEACHAGALHWRLFRIERALADLAVNHDGQSDEGAIAAMRATLGFPAYFARFESDIARMKESPGSRVAEALTALALRDHLLASAGVARFHHRVLATAPLTLQALRQIRP